MNVSDLLYRPDSYFAQFGRGTSSRLVALGAFFIMELVEAHEALFEFTLGDTLPLVLGVTLNTLLTILIVGGLWYFLGARVLGGEGSFDMTVRGLGYAYLWPALLSLLVVVTLYDPSDSGGGTLKASLGLRLALWLWSMVQSAFAIRHIHSLSWPRTLGVLLWVPVLLVVVLSAVVLLGLE